MKTLKSRNLSRNDFTPHFPEEIPDSGWGPALAARLSNLSAHFEPIQFTFATRLFGCVKVDSISTHGQL